VGHYSQLLFVYLQVDGSAAKTILAKQAFKKFAAEHGIYSDNGQFADNAFKQACKANRQQPTFFGVNAQFQNGIAKIVIRNLFKSAHKQLLHAHAHLPEGVHFAFWPYTLCNAALLDNSLPLGWEFQFLVPISGTPIRSRIPISFPISEIPVGLFFRIPLLKNCQIGIPNPKFLLSLPFDAFPGLA
jgi:hypothetical protein